MVYSAFVRLCFMVYFYWHVFVTLTTKYTLYFTYIASLNYWETNIGFIVVFFFCFFGFFISFFTFFFYFFFFSISSFYLTVSVKVLIPTLIVGTVAIHPVAFYFFISIYLSKIFTKNFFPPFFIIPVSVESLSFWLFVTLLLGGVWATQSISWGYFWVNDLVEWILFVFILCLLLKIHIWVFVYYRINVFLYSLLFISFLLLIRLNLFSTRHSFISNSSTTLLTFLVYFLFIYIYIKITTQNVSKVVSYNFVCFYFLLSLFVYSRYYLLVYKFLWVCLSLFIFAKKIITGTIKLKSHLYLLTSLFLWLIFFKFFFLNYSINDRFYFHEMFVFNNIFSFDFYVFNLNKLFITLELVNFFLVDCIYLVESFLKSFTASNTLNNLILIYLLIVVYIFKLGWI